MKEKVALLGASGFVGQNLIEDWYLDEKATIVPIIRHYSSLASFARFNLDWRLAQTTDAYSLAKALDGCSSLVHCASGDEHTILNLVEPVYRACEMAKVKRIVYLSSASVYGQNIPQGTSDSTVVPLKHSHPYNKAKAKSEKLFFKLREKGNVELVILRPGIVYGPGSRWISEFLEKLFAGQASWVNHGQGIMNGIYVGNLIHAIEQALIQKGEGQAFIVGDEQVYSWSQFYGMILKKLNFSPNAIRNLEVKEEASFDIIAFLRNIKSLDFVQQVSSYVPSTFKRVIKGTVKSIPCPVQKNPWLFNPVSKPELSYEMQNLFQNQYKLPHTKAKELLEYTPPYSFNDGMQKCLEWLESCGLPIEN